MYVSLQNSEGTQSENESLAGFNAVTIYDYEFEKSRQQTNKSHTNRISTIDS